MRYGCLVLACCVVFSGCATTTPATYSSYRRASATTARMEETGQSLVKAGREIDAAVNSLNSLQGKSGQELRQQYDVFIRRVNVLETMVKRLAAKQNKLETASKKYFNAWENELKRFTNASLKRKSRQRRQMAIDSFNTMFDALQVEDEAYRLILNDMKDIRRFLGYELTPDSIISISENIKRVNDDVVVVHRKIDQALKELQGTQTPLPTETAVPGPSSAPAQPAG